VQQCQPGNQAAKWGSWLLSASLTVIIGDQQAVAIPGVDPTCRRQVWCGGVALLRREPLGVGVPEWPCTIEGGGSVGGGGGIAWVSLWYISEGLRAQGLTHWRADTLTDA
jgi:hypothetical protein